MTTDELKDQIYREADNIYNITKSAKYGYDTICQLDIENESDIFNSAKAILDLLNNSD